MNWETWLPLLIAIAAWVPKVWEWIGGRKTREAGLASDYLKIADMSGDQLEKKINQVNVLESKIEALQAQITAMQLDFSTQKTENERVIEALKAYIKVLIDTLRARDIPIPPRPEILKESDPKIPAIGAKK